MPRFILTAEKPNPFFMISTWHYSNQLHNFEQFSVVFMYGYNNIIEKKQIRSFRNKYLCQRIYENIIEKKLNDGWQKVEPDIPIFINLPRHPALEKTLCENLEDNNLWLIYGDWLANQDDPRGELINLAYDFKETYKKRIEEIMRNKWQWAGETLAYYLVYYDSSDNIYESKTCYFFLEWQIAFVKKLTLDLTKKDCDYNKEVIEALLHSPVCAFLNHIIISQHYTDKRPVVKEVLKHINPYSLYHLSINSSYINPLHTILNKFIHLKSLTIKNHRRIELGKSKHETLQRLTLECTMSEKSLEDIQTLSLPNLKYLDLKFNGLHDNKFQYLEPLLNHNAFPKLLCLSLRNFHFTNTLIHLIAHSKLLKQLETLILSEGVFETTNINTLIILRAYFQHLKALKLYYNQMPSNKAYLEQVFNNIKF